LKRLSSPARTFLLMNAASVPALAVFLYTGAKALEADRAAAAEAKASAS
jgi:hypothetical protein